MRQVLAPLIYVFAFLAVVIGVQAVAGLVFSSRDQTQRVNRRLTLLAAGMKPMDVYAALVRQPLTTEGGHVLASRLYRWFALFCRQADIEMAPERLLFLVAGLAGGLWLLCMVLLRSSGLAGFIVNALLLLPVSSLICALGAWLWLGRRRAMRLRALETQMPLALDVITRAMRAGHPPIAAVKLAGEEMGDPIGSEFGLIVDETTYGFAFREALTNFARRTGSPDAHFFAVSVGIQSETGGNLAEILEGLAAVIRGRTLLGKRVKALASEGRASAWLLSALPVFLIGAMMMIHPAFYTSKFSDPIFWPVIGAVMVVYVLGLVMIRRIVNFRY
jgi:tight adherence protein B